MASNIAVNTAVHFNLLNDEMLPKSSDNSKPSTTETSKSDEVDDDVFAHENEAARASSNKDQVIRTTHVANLTGSLSKQPSFDHHTSVTSQQDVVSSVSTASIVVSVPTTRRPSYTSKAPSALTNLPKTLDDISNSPNNLSTTFGLHNVTVQPNRNSVSDFENDESLRQKELIEQASFDSIDEYSNPGTPIQSSHGSPGSISNNVSVSGHKHRDKSSRMRTEVLTRGRWEMAAKADVLTVRCRENVGELHKQKFGSGSKGKCIKVL